MAQSAAPCRDAYCVQLSSKLVNQNRSLKGNYCCTAALQVLAGPDFKVKEASNAAQYRAAAQLRASCFYEYPTDRSEFAVRSHRKVKADMEWTALEEKVKGTHMGYEGIRVACFVATLDDSDTPEAAAVRADMDLSCKLPATDATPPQLVVGTLDLNQGLRLPAEELIGKLPEGPAAQQQRAYLSNVCVAWAVRRQGIAEALIRTAVQKAQNSGIQQLYVHVVASNIAARMLYEERCGFVPEQEETAAVAYALSRPPRLLLRLACNCNNE